MTLQLFFTLLVSVAGIAGASYGLWMVRTGRTTFGDGMEGARPPEAEVRRFGLMLLFGAVVVTAVNLFFIRPLF